MARKKKTARTLVGFVLDKSGSMNSRRSATIDGFNEYIETLARESEGDVYMTLVQFDTRIQRMFANTPLHHVQRLDSYGYRPGGMTALNDAVWETVQDLEYAFRVLGHKKSDHTLLIIMTDGYENASRERSTNEIRRLLDRKREEGWEIVYLGAGVDSWQGADNYGIRHDSRINYGDSPAHQRHAIYDMAQASVGVTRGASAQSYLAVSPVKSMLENEAGSVTNITTHTTPPYSSTPSTPKKRTRRNASNDNWKRQKRDSSGRFIPR